MSDEDELSEDEFFSAKEVASYQQTGQMQEENTIEERLQNTKDIVIINE